MPRNSAKQVGALWRHENQKVGQFLTGILDLGGLGESPIAVFKKHRKERLRKQLDFQFERCGWLSGSKFTDTSGYRADPGDGLPC